MTNGAFRAASMALFMSALPSMAAAQTVKDKLWKPDGDRGLALAQRLCANCHVVQPEQSGQVPAGVPTFASIAARPDQTSKRIENVLIHPHPPMPDIQLTRHEIGDLIAYIDRLRRKSGGAPLKPDEKINREKAKLPKQS